MDLEEDYYPDSGSPIVGLKRSHHYFHSGFVDTVLTGVVGIRPSAENTLEVNPLIGGSAISYFRAERVIYHGHEVAVQWDATGSRYGFAGLQVEVDGKVVASSPKLTRLSVPLARTAPPAITRRLAKSVQLSSTTAYPRGSVSIANTDAQTIYGSIDGRIWFFPETDVANGWSTPAGNGSEVWYQIDFGAQTAIGGAEIAFFADAEQGYDVPENYRVQVLKGSTWQDAVEAKYAKPVANGITEVEWKGETVQVVRLVFTPRRGLKVRLVEFKVW